MAGKNQLEGEKPISHRALAESLGHSSVGISQIDHTDDQAILATCREELVKLLPTVTGTAKLAVIRELLDRIEGKPMQRVQAAVAHVQRDQSLTQTDEEILRLYYVKK